MSSPTANSIGTTTFGTPSNLGIEAALIKGIKWGGGVGQGVSLTYSFPSGAARFAIPYSNAFPGDGEWSNWFTTSTQDQTAIVDALMKWSDITNLTFNLAADNAATVGDLRFARTLVRSGLEAAHTYYPENQPRGGDVWLQNDMWHTDAPSEIPRGSEDFLILVHEIGHALGLTHPFMDLSNPDPPFLDIAHNTLSYTVMAYNTKLGAQVHADFYPTTLQYLDILAIQAIYGNKPRNAGPNTYTFNDSNQYWETIYDTGGIDEIVYDGHMLGGRIDLSNATFSELGRPINFRSDGTSTRDTVGLGPGTVIENATGGFLDDTIIGNNVDNTIRGRTGDDIIDGGAGTDTAIFAGRFIEYDLTPLSGNGVRVSGPDGTDTLNNIEKLVFDDRTVFWPLAPAAPDLVITDLRLSIATAPVNTQTTLSYTVTNRGSVASPYTSISVVLSSNDIYGPGDAQQAQLSVIPLDPGESFTFDFPFFFLNQPGSNYIIAALDPLNTLDEQDETNNVSNAVAISVSSAAPDLDADNLSLSSTTIAAGGNVTVTYSLSNIGAAAPASTVGIYRAPLGEETSPILLATRSFGPLVAGSSITESVSLRLTATGTYTILAIADDGGLIGELRELNNISNSVQITVTGSNAAPVITSDGGSVSADISVPEGTTFVTTVRATDPEGSAVTYSIASGDDAKKFQINPTSGVLSFITPPNFEARADVDHNNTYTVMVRASDGGVSDDQFITVRLGNANDAPEIISNGGGGTATVSLPENRATVGKVMAIDPEAGTTLTYSIAGGSDAARFQIDATSGLLSFVSPPDFEAPADVDHNDSYVVQVRASDGSLFDLQMITVNITNLNDPIVGDDNANSLTGDALDNILDGRRGNDTLNGGVGADQMIGGLGDDIYVVDNAGDSVAENPNEGNDTVQTTLASYALGSNVENLTFTDGATHTAFGNALANTMTGGTGSDTLVAHTVAGLFAQEHDTLSGGDGNDTLYGEATDTLNGGAGFNVLQVINDFAMNLDLVATGIEYVVSGFGNDTYTAAAATTTIEVYGGGGNDQITGGSGNDNLWAGVGNDALVGNGGNDLLVGDLGADSLSGGAGNDRLYIDSSDISIDGGADFDAAYIATGSGVSINLAASHIEWVADFAGGNDTIDGSGSSANLEIYAAGGSDSVTGGSGADFVWGEAGNDTLTGNGGNDTLVGGTGSDRITGGPGTDALYGNSGNGGDGAIDTFAFADGWGTDFVFDFEHGVDKIDMTAVSGLNTFSQLTLVNTSSGHCYVSFAGNLIALAGMAGQITQGDFLL